MGNVHMKNRLFSIKKLNEANQETVIMKALKFYQKSCVDRMIHPLEPDLVLTEITERHIRFFNHDGLLATVYCAIKSVQFEKGLKMEIKFPDQK